ncbi:hypothetical protein M9288_004241 [Salmonella enterica]|nr:hypothetical protein [Salmonella enterica]EIV7305189.1 hypothetical protein [Salmonella enterica subsp. enterica serovar Panama]EBG1336840.1 hypothetical protein [Salmonella enterica]EBH0288926.1 hypothetical protein [Salmonella enterica]ECK6782582.1 hypothetical protein [Salmonella enterica]
MVGSAYYLYKNTVSSVGALWTIASMPAYITKVLFTGWRVIYRYYVFLLATEKLLLRLAMMIMDKRNMLFINV